MPTARTTQLVAEVLSVTPAAARTTQLVAEVLSLTPTVARTSQFLVEVLTVPIVPIPPPPPGAIEPIRRLRQAPHLWDGTSGHRLKYPGFQLLVEAGAPRDTDGPMSWVLQWSDDGGHSWSHEHRIEGSRLGEHTFRFWWRRLGQSRDRVFRVINSDDAKIVIVDALLVPDPVEGSS
jgi:hypothetical protein